MSRVNAKNECFVNVIIKIQVEYGFVPGSARVLRKVVLEQGCFECHDSSCHMLVIWVVTHLFPSLIVVG